MPPNISASGTGIGYLVDNMLCFAYKKCKQFLMKYYTQNNGKQVMKEKFTKNV